MSDVDSRHLQLRFFEWVRKVYGYEAATSSVERGARVFEEAAELAQSVGVPRPLLDMILDRVYSKTPGVVATEVAQTFLTLLVLAECLRLDVGACLMEEWAVIEVNGPDYYRARFERKKEAGLVAEDVK